MATNRTLQAVLITKDKPAITNRVAQGVVIYQDAPTTQIRNVRGYALTSPPTQAQLRNVRGYALTAATKPPPTAQTGVNAMLWLLNQNINIATPFTLSQLTIGTPSSYSDPTGLNNAQVTVTAKSGSGYQGSMTAYYKRRTLDSVFSSTAWLLGTISSATTIRALIPQINTAYGVGLDPTDVVDGPVNAGATSLTLTIASGSYMFQPGSALMLPSVSLSNATPVTILSGFDSAAGAGPRPVTTLLMHFDSSTNLLLDSTGKNTATAVGTVTASSTAKFGTQGVVIGASGSNISIPDASWFRFTGADATLEAWVYPTSVSQNGLLFDKDTGTSPYTELQYISNQWRLYLDSASAALAINANMVANTWYHIALVSYKGVWYLYQNGVLLGQATGGTFGNNSNPFRIGGVTSAPWQGVIDEVRISNIARYTAAFTPPVAAFVAD